MSVIRDLCDPLLCVLKLISSKGIFFHRWSMHKVTSHHVLSFVLSNIFVDWLRCSCIYHKCIACYHGYRSGTVNSRSFVGKDLL